MLLKDEKLRYFHAQRYMPLLVCPLNIVKKHTAYTFFVHLNYCQIQILEKGKYKRVSAYTHHNFIKFTIGLPPNTTPLECNYY